ncbi:hypothetical protein TPHA_0I00440 [Tetrapisispora phaffii CBS 4417]|uniref:CSC1/OSCA1-like 7TM region domain-containing protein n=1 Tax=Tetrapisispora phaffii (strain ATCC 24235 / CBS 4417 / NBRC 1672 / NRRL Y-8282 / UCD 70-5) TaxID=1071381 RepID=G8BXC3_TETPH|nr:hypothetical protein TPHA_0I00440 [Tetrapisispora phaffii CBS 4417]CCE64551.1 hypothetical protein TPHA_0I00440 [Tetrapisispora phaffii CBS 4417]
MQLAIGSCGSFVFWSRCVLDIDRPKTIILHTRSMSTTDVTGTSTQQVLTSLVSNGVIFGAFMTGFLLLRIKLKRIYEPKSSFALIAEEKRPEPLPSGLWQWFLPLLKKSDNFIIKQAGLDGYFFLRYLFLIAAYTGCSIVYVFPILLSVNAANGGNSAGLDVLAYQNVTDPKRYYAHVFVGWVFFWGFILLMYRELYYYNSVQQNVVSSNRYAKKLSSRTVLFTTVPKQYLSETEFSKLFDGVKRVWIARAQNGVEKLVKERENMAMNLENILNNLLKKKIKKIGKDIKKNKETDDIKLINRIRYANSIDKIVTVSEFLTDKERPKLRVQKWKFWTKKVDALDYFKEQLPILNAKIGDLQSNQMDSSPFNSVFVEFESQYQAQVASQLVPYHAPLFLTPSYIGIHPQSIIWFNLRMMPYERLIRQTAATASMCALVIVWAFPVAFVGLISNITYLTNKLPWLNFIYKLPDVLLGLLTSLAPTVALALLMMCLPVIIRNAAKFAGAPSTQYVEYYTQQTYFAFQVIQVFLVTTIASAATSTVTQIVEEPTKAMELLAENLPKASNFYIAYIILQGMSVTGSALLQIVPLAIYYTLGKVLDPTPRKKYNRFSKLASLSWGTTFPVYTNLAVIIFSYAIISPIILLFATFGFFLLWVAYLYNLNYVYAEAPDARGIHYPRALFQTMVGLYIGQICLLGLFVVGKGWGPIVLQIVCLVVTVLLHLFLNHCFDHLMKNIPIDTMKPLDGESHTASFKNIYSQKHDDPFGDVKVLPNFPIRKYRSRSGSAGTDVERINSNTLDDKFNIQYEVSNTNNNGLVEMFNGDISATPLLADGDDSAIPTAPFWKRFIFPHTYCSYKAVKNRIPDIYHVPDPDEITDPDELEHAYDYPAVSAKCPYLWITKDPYGFSQSLITDLAEVIKISDEGASLDENGKITWEGTPPSYEYNLDPLRDSDAKDIEINYADSPIDKDDPFTDEGKSPREGEKSL